MTKPHLVQDATGVIVENPVLGILQAHGLVVPTDGDEGYAPGCLFHHTDGGDGTSLYVNEGTKASADFNAITVAA